MTERVVPEMAFDNSSSDDDDGPEEMSVTASRAESISQMKHIQDSLRRSREEERERRRQRNEMFKIQKEMKLNDLSKRKLSDDVLAAVSAKWAKKSQITEDRGTSHNKEPETDDSNDDGGKDKNAELEADDLSDSGVEDVTDGQSSAEEFIPFSKGNGLSLVTPGALAKKAQSAAQTALNFKQNWLYNKSTIPRENTQERRARAAKRKALNMK